MKHFTILSITALLLVQTSFSWAETVTISSELKRLRTAEHLFRPQDYRLLQYSGFNRRGGNPDRFDCLYEEDGWRVVADHKGPGVVSRIWTTHDTTWHEIRIEVDGQIIFTGKANQFFEQDKLPFVRPLSEVRNSVTGRATAEGETPGKKEWAVSYVPIPFAKRFRYLQRDKLYANIDVKAFSDDVEVESFLNADWHALKAEFEATAAVWNRMDLYCEELADFRKVAKRVAVPAVTGESSVTVGVAELAGPAIVRQIRVKVNDGAASDRVELRIAWDGAEEPDVVAPLDHGFGSREHRTLALGQTADGWRVCSLPMPFRKKAAFSLVSQSKKPVECDVEMYVEENASLPEDVLCLHSVSNTGQVKKGTAFEHPDLPLADFFYANGYTAFERRGAGQIVAYMDLFNCQPELDEHIFVDDERTFPENRWNGTGHEDLFDMAWGHKPVSAPMTSGGSEKFEEVNVKLFWNDPMPFRTAIRFNWEWAFQFGVRPPRDARFASVVYWYEAP